MINKRYFGAQNLLFLVKLFYVFEFRCAWSKTLVFIWWFVRAQSPNRKRRPLVIFVHTCAQIPLQNSPNRAWERKLMKCYVSSMDNHDFCFVSFEGRDQLNFKLCYGRLNWLIFFWKQNEAGLTRFCTLWSATWTWMRSQSFSVTWVGCLIFRNLFNRPFFENKLTFSTVFFFFFFTTDIDRHRHWFFFFFFGGGGGQGRDFSLFRYKLKDCGCTFFATQATLRAIPHASHATPKFFRVSTLELAVFILQTYNASSEHLIWF